MIFSQYAARVIAAFAAIETDAEPFANIGEAGRASAVATQFANLVLGDLTANTDVHDDTLLSRS